jgi:hypothetical protein
MTREFRSTQIVLRWKRLNPETATAKDWPNFQTSGSKYTATQNGSWLRTRQLPNPAHHHKSTRTHLSLSLSLSLSRTGTRKRTAKTKASALVFCFVAFPAFLAVRWKHRTVSDESKRLDLLLSCVSGVSGRPLQSIERSATRASALVFSFVAFPVILDVR